MKTPLRILRALHVAQRIEGHSRGLATCCRITPRLGRMLNLPPGINVEIRHEFVADPSRLAPDTIQEIRFLRVRLRDFERQLRRQFQ